MILICNYDSAIHDSEPRWHKPMPATACRWMLKLWAKGANGAIVERTFRPRGPCAYSDLRQQHIEPAIDEVREECGGVTRMKFWLWKAR